MPCRPRARVCINPACAADFITTDLRKKFCNSSCSSKFNNANRGPPSDEQKQKISEALKAYYQANPKAKMDTATATKKGNASQKGKHKQPTSLYEISARTRQKIVSRLGLGCSRCGWDKATCDLHHINGRKIPDPHNHLNIALICPNCHREFHQGKFPKSELIPLAVAIGDRWKQYYNG